MSEGSRPLLLFQVGARVFAAGAGDVRRIAGCEPRPVGAIGETALGRPIRGHRGLVVGITDGECTMLVDGILGLRAIADAEFQPMPRFVREVLPSAAFAGFAMLDEVPTLVVHLPTLVEEREPGAYAAQGEEKPRHV